MNEEWSMREKTPQSMLRWISREYEMSPADLDPRDLCHHAHGRLDERVDVLCVDLCHDSVPF